VEKIMKTRKLILALAATAAIAFGPQLAHAACSGDACNFVSFDGKTLTNKDPQLKISVGVCSLDASGRCGPAGRGYTLDPKTSQAVVMSGPVGVRFADFIGARPVPGPKPADKAPVDKALVDKVTVTNGGQVPLKIVILDMGKVDIGRTPNYATGSVDIKLNRGVAKYHWEAFTPGAVEPCQVVHDVTVSAITAQCQQPHPKLPDAAHQLVTRPVSADSGLRWAEQCRTDGTGGPTACCERQRKAEPYCMQQPLDRSSSSDCEAAETLCRQTQRSSLKPSER
jgi:hypothetical protein